MNLSPLIASILERHDLTKIRAAFRPEAEGTRARIGFLGEFSSGKSTLINALVGRKVLPARADPTTGNITIIEPQAGLAEVTRFLLNSDGSLTPINAETFSGMATGKVPGRAIVHVPTGPCLLPGFQIIDSPGLNAMVEGHGDLTLGELFSLDGLVVCLSANAGEVPISLIRVLQHPSIQSMGDRILFALTFADQKSGSDLQGIQQKIEVTLQGVGLEPHLVPTYAPAALAGDSEALRSFQEAFDRRFIQRAVDLQLSQHSKHLRELGAMTVKAFKEELNGMDLSAPEFEHLEQELRASIESVRRSRAKESGRLSEWETDLRRAFHDLAAAFGPKFASADPQCLEDLEKEMESALQVIARTHAKRYGEGVEKSISELPKGHASGLTGSLRANAEYVDGAVTVTTVVLTAAITWGASASAAAAEVAAGGAGASRAIVKGASKKALEEALKESAKKSLIQKGLQFLGEVIKNVNPLEYVGSIARNQWNAHDAAIQLPQIAGRLADAVTNDIRAQLDKTCFRPLEQELAAFEDGLRQARIDRGLDLERLTAKRIMIQQDLCSLEKALAQP
jgi:hypothetical protein